MRLLFLAAALMAAVSGCVDADAQTIKNASASPSASPPIASVAGATSSPPSPDASDISESEPAYQINPLGMTLKDRFPAPSGFERIAPESGSFAEYLQNLPLKPDGSKVKYFDGREKTSNVYLAVIDFTLGDRDLQQCADAVMRLRAEYLYAQGANGEIQFHLVSGFLADFSKWASGYGISVSRNNVSWIKNSLNDASYESLQRFLDMVYAYASTLSLEKELANKDSDLAAGDVFIRGGSPGHAVIVADTAINSLTGEKLFMLAQSFMPAQDIQILSNPQAFPASPWYSDNFGDELTTPEWTFRKEELKTWP
ncbi:MAG: DUF4846 domain-containing protein [Clostridiales bacterium]|nr:DUF4846 domain-containing protein [Clostridiales bacterium]